LTITRAEAPLVAVAGVGEVLGTSVYPIGAQAGIAVAAIVASQFATIATVGAYLLFGESLGRVQMAASVWSSGVTAVSALSA
ncbi:MAG TPA: hypothetical protein VK656_06385, partial [Candidatus Acidoferrum sp.]|nr:hypothetical protein [Candidatus Acidoferrum sp.]